MAITAMCRFQDTALLLRAVICKTNLGNENLFTDEQTFLGKILTQKPSFALVTSEFISRTDLFADIRQCSPRTRIVLCLLPETIKSLAFWPLLEGLDVYALCTLPELSDCLSTLTLGRFYTSSLLATHPANRRVKPLPGWSELTEREREIIKLMAEGNNGPQIARALFISPKTIDNHKYNISQKLNITGGPGSLVKFSLMNRESILSLFDDA